MRFVYYCNSPYQLITVLNLNYQRKYNNFENIRNYCSDLIILDCFPNEEEIVNKIIEKKYFDNVYIAKRVKNEGIFHRIASLLDVIYPYRYLYKSYKAKKENTINYYDYISTPKISKIAYSLWILNKKAKLQLHEEGVASYFGGRHMCEERGMHKELYKIVNGWKDFFEYEKLYLNKKSLYLDNDIERTVQIPKIDSQLLEDLKQSFVNEDVKKSNKRIYWIGQYIDDNIHNITYDFIKGKEGEVVYCPHPRIRNNDQYHLEELNTSLIWELNLLNINDINNRCLLTIHSTAAFSAKVLYDLEPYVIFTINMIEKRNESFNFSKARELIYKLRDSYKDSSKVMIPNNIEELNACIKKVIGIN